MEKTSQHRFFWTSDHNLTTWKRTIKVLTSLCIALVLGLVNGGVDISMVVWIFCPSVNIPDGNTEFTAELMNLVVINVNM